MAEAADSGITELARFSRGLRRSDCHQGVQSHDPVEGQGTPLVLQHGFGDSNRIRKRVASSRRPSVGTFASITAEPRCCGIPRQ
jgi:hypothetical protein